MQADKALTYGVGYTESALEQKAEQLATRLGLTMANQQEHSLQLVLTPEHLELREPTLGGPIWIDFLAGKNAHRRQFGGGRGQPLARAIGLKKGETPSVIDATAGYGRDAFVLATLGCQVTLLEQNILLVALLEDALFRSQQDVEVATIAARMQVHHTQSIDYLNALSSDKSPHVIYLDPMYPTREKSALVKKEMQLLHQLVGADESSEYVLAIARQKAVKRVVVKRPKSAPFIADQSPSTSIRSKNTRYDIYITH